MDVVLVERLKVESRWFGIPLDILCYCLSPYLLKKLELVSSVEIANEEEIHLSPYKDFTPEGELQLYDWKGEQQFRTDSRPIKDRALQGQLVRQEGYVTPRTGVHGTLASYTQEASVFIDFRTLQIRRAGERSIYQIHLRSNEVYLIDEKKQFIYLHHTSGIRQYSYRGERLRKWKSSSGFRPINGEMALSPDGFVFLYERKSREIIQFNASLQVIQRQPLQIPEMPNYFRLLIDSRYNRYLVYLNSVTIVSTDHLDWHTIFPSPTYSDTRFLLDSQDRIHVLSQPCQVIHHQIYA